MEPIAFIEVVDRHRDVVARHPVHRWPVKLGRGYQADVIVDDAFVAPLHAEIAPDASGRFVISDLGSVNGIFLVPSEKRADRLEVGQDELVRLGHTQIRVRAPSYAVAEERPMRAEAVYRRPAAFVALATVTVALLLWNSWIVTIDADERYAYLIPAIAVAIGVAVWIVIWSVVSSAVGLRSNFAAHGSVACGGLLAIVAVDSFVDYLSFGLDVGWLEYVGVAALAAILAYMVYRHLRLNSRARPIILGSIATGITALAFGVIIGLNIISDSQAGIQRYNDSIKAPIFLLVSGASTDAFFANAEALKRRVDAMDREVTGRAKISAW